MMLDQMLMYVGSKSKYFILSVCILFHSIAKSCPEAVSGSCVRNIRRAQGYVGAHEAGGLGAWFDFQATSPFPQMRQ